MKWQPPPEDGFASVSDKHQWAAREALSRRGAEARQGAEFDFAEPLAPLPQQEGLLTRGFEESVLGRVSRAGSMVVGAVKNAVSRLPGRDR